MPNMTPISASPPVTPTAISVIVAGIVVDGAAILVQEKKFNALVLVSIIVLSSAQWTGGAAVAPACSMNDILKSPVHPAPYVYAVTL